MPYSKDILELKRHIIRAAESSQSYFDLNRLIVDVRKVNDSEIPYSGLGARSPNDYFPSIKIIGSELRPKNSDTTTYNYIDTAFTLGGRYSSNIITSDVPFFVSGMSYGSLKLPAKIALHLALNRLAKEGIRVVMNTGEGGA
ncbi:MAG TPA: glutamate synthase-related protein, partial [Nitrososphaeraceae archaeon]